MFSNNLGQLNKPSMKMLAGRFEGTGLGGAASGPRIWDWRRRGEGDRLGNKKELSPPDLVCQN